MTARNRLFSKALHLFDMPAIDPRVLMAGDLIILKFGGSLITDKKSEIPKVKHGVLDRIGDVLRDKKKNIF